MEDPTITNSGERLLTYINKLDPYVMNLAAIFLGFVQDLEALGQFLDNNLKIMKIRTKAYHGHLGQ